MTFEKLANGKAHGQEHTSLSEQLMVNKFGTTMTVVAQLVSIPARHKHTDTTPNHDISEASKWQSTWTRSYISRRTANGK